MDASFTNTHNDETAPKIREISVTLCKNLHRTKIVNFLKNYLKIHKKFIFFKIYFYVNFSYVIKFFNKAKMFLMLFYQLGIMEFLRAVFWREKRTSVISMV